MESLNYAFTSYSNRKNIAVTGIGNLNTGDNSIDIYPNPANDVINITLHQPVDDGVLTICNVLGQQVYQNKIAGATNSTVNIDIGALSQGVYILKMETGGQSLVKRIVKL